MTQENTPQYQFIFSLDQEFKMPNREFYEALVVATDRVFHDALTHSELLGMVHEQGPDRDTFGLKILRCNVGRFYTYKDSDVSFQFGSKSSSDPDPIEKGVFEKATVMVVNTRGLPWKEFERYLLPLQKAWSKLGYQWPSSTESLIPCIAAAAAHDSQDVVDALTKEMEKRTLAYVARPSYLLRLDGLARLDIPALLQVVPKPKGIKQVYLSSTGLRELPHELQRFPNLLRLSISQNEISTIPAWIANFESLIEIRLYDNPISEKELAVLRTRMPQVKVLI